MQTSNQPSISLQLPAGAAAIHTPFRYSQTEGFSDLTDAAAKWLSLLAHPTSNDKLIWPLPHLDAQSLQAVHDMLEHLDKVHPNPLQEGFEGQPLIAGAVYRCSQLGGPSDAAMIKLHFQPGAVDLPIHIHPLSARVLIVLQGKGTFYFSHANFESFSGTPVYTQEIGPGSVVVFQNNYLHTFGAAQSSLTMLSFHFPFVELNDEHQWSLPSQKILPRNIPAQL